MYPEAAKAVVKVEGHQKAVTTLLVACSYEQDDLPGCRRQLDKWVAMQSQGIAEVDKWVKGCGGRRWRQLDKWVAMQSRE